MPPGNPSRANSGNLFASTHLSGRVSPHARLRCFQCPTPTRARTPFLKAEFTALFTRSIGYRMRSLCLKGRLFLHAPSAMIRSRLSWCADCRNWRAIVAEAFPFMPCRSSTTKRIPPSKHYYCLKSVPESAAGPLVRLAPAFCPRSRHLLVYLGNQWPVTCAFHYNCVHHIQGLCRDLGGR